MLSVIPLFNKYPTVAHSYHSRGQTHSRAEGFKHLCTLEPYTVLPQNWDLNIINQYDSYITFNRKFCEKHGILTKSYIMNGCTCGNISDRFTSFIPYDKKIKGVCTIGKRGHDSRDGNIYFLRQELMEKLPVEPFLVKHIYAPKPWGGLYYQGHCPGSPWDVRTVKKVNEYLFCFCPENTYHTLWSWGYLTEKLFRSFKAKTVAIYIGCYNIEDYVPKDLYIDFRDFYRDYDKLAEYLIKFPKEKYLKMTEKAYKWAKTCGLRSIEELETVFKTVTKI